MRAVGEATRLQRLAFGGSRLSAVRASEDHAVREVLGVGAFDEEDLYAALEFLAKPQGATEAALAGRRRARSFSTT
ncbi:hypothetical protein [Limisphaera sp. VF-2]|uniref:hypothetical protein n=1 Tax=Limisphaera sp. VF-2 TaxID=3400418 RepID=UPI0017778295